MRVRWIGLTAVMIHYPSGRAIPIRMAWPRDACAPAGNSDYRPAARLAVLSRVPADISRQPLEHTRPSVLGPLALSRSLILSGC